MRKSTREKRETGVRRELEQHVAALVRDGVASGLSPEEAHRRARLVFGGVDHTLEECRDVRRGAWLRDLGRDVAHAVRLFRRAPAFTAIVVTTLAVGLGVNTAVFSLVHRLLLAPLPVSRPDRLVTLAHGDATRGRGTGFPDAVLRRFETDQPLVRGVLARGGLERVTLGVDGLGEPAVGELVSGGFFEVLGLAPAAGRLFTAADDLAPGAHPVVVLSHGFWQRRFAGDPGVVGRMLTVSGHPMRVIGVSPKGFDGLDPGQHVDLRVPLAMVAEVRGGRTSSGRRPAGWELQLVARLADGVAPAQAEQALGAAFGRIRDELGVVGPGPLTLRPAATGIGRTRAQYETALWVLMAMTIGVLAVASANLAMLFAARASTRRPEWVVRAALGAGWGRLARQLAAESLLLAAAGAVAGAGVAIVAANWLARFATGSISSLHIDVRPDAAVLTVHLTAGLAVAAALGMGSIVRLRRESRAPWLGTGARTVIGAGRHGLIAAQVAVSIVVLVGAGLFLRTIGALRATELGLRPEHVLLVALDPKTAGRRDAEVAPFYRDVRERVRAVPGVTAVTFSTIRALSGTAWSAGVAVQGRAADPTATALRNAVGPGYFGTLGMRVLAGRDLSTTDDAAAPRVAVVNQAFVKRYLADRSPLGVVIGTDRPEYAIVGVVNDARQVHVRDAPAPTWFVPYEQRPGLKHLDLVVRTTGEPERVAADVQAAIAGVDGRAALFEVRSQASQIDDLLVTERLLARLATIFAGIATTLAALGLYGLLAFLVARRRREIGLRLALGARPAAVARAVAADVGRAVGIGLIAGLLAAAALGRYAGAILYGVAPMDAGSWAGAIAVMLAAVALGASWPLLRAMRIDPVRALKE
jgi:predicted permease